MRPGPVAPRRWERDEHEAAGHAVYRSWCECCVRARGIGTQHRSRGDDSEEGALPEIVMDYGFMGG